MNLVPNETALPGAIVFDDLDAVGQDPCEQVHERFFTSRNPSQSLGLVPRSGATPSIPRNHIEPQVTC